MSLLNRHLRENPDSDILKNIFVNANLVNEFQLLVFLPALQSLLFHQIYPLLLLKLNFQKLCCRCRYFDGAGYEGTEKQKQMIVMGLGNRDI